jgi:hypothetical protein
MPNDVYENEEQKELALGRLTMLLKKIIYGTSPTILMKRKTLK